jgi:hypothetical protein
VVTKAGCASETLDPDLNPSGAAESPQDGLFRAPILVRYPARDSAPTVGSQWESFHPQRYTATARRSPTPSTAFGRRRRNWIDAHGSVPARQIVDASCGNKRCITLRHSYLRPRVEQPRKYPKIAKRVHRLKIGQDFDVPGVGTDERSRNRFRSGLYAAVRLDKVSVRGQPDGSVRVTKVGEWSSLRV